MSRSHIDQNLYSSEINKTMGDDNSEEYPKLFWSIVAAFIFYALVFILIHNFSHPKNINLLILLFSVLYFLITYLLMKLFS